MLGNDYFDSFDRSFLEIVKYFHDFVKNEDLISKIRSMFMYIFRIIRKFTKKHIFNNYCQLSFDVRHFENEDDDVARIEECLKKIKVLAGYLEIIELKLWENDEFCSLFS